MRNLNSHLERTNGPTEHDRSDPPPSKPPSISMIGLMSTHANSTTAQLELNTSPSLSDSVLTLMTNCSVQWWASLCVLPWLFLFPSPRTYHTMIQKHYEFSDTYDAICKPRPYQNGAAGHNLKGALVFVVIILSLPQLSPYAVFHNFIHVHVSGWIHHASLMQSQL